MEERLIKSVAISVISLLSWNFGTNAESLEPVFVLSTRGKPIMRDSSGVVTYVVPLEDMPIGVSLILDDADNLRVCFARKRLTYRIEGAGTVMIGDDGFKTLKGKPRVIEVGACDPAAAANSTGGVLFRSLPEEGRH